MHNIIQYFDKFNNRFSKLSDATISLRKGTLIKELLEDDGFYPVVNSGRTYYGKYKNFNNTGNSFTVASRGEYAGFVMYQSNNYWAGGLCYPYRSNNEKIILTKYIYYYLKRYENLIMNSLVDRGSIPALNKSRLDEFLIAFPPLDIQEEIVHVLDNFTELKAELTAELTARKQQYEYYLNQFFLISEDNVKYKRINEVGKILRGNYVTKKDVEQGDIPVILGGQQPAYYCNKSNHEGEAIVISRSGAYAGYVSFWDQKIFVTDGFIIETNDSVLLKYLYYFLKSMQNEIYKGKRGGGVPHVRGSEIEKILVPIQSLYEQQRIVDILDKFDKLVNDINEGLPAEIAARQKQYEYYRDKLLTFKEVGNESI